MLTIERLKESVSYSPESGVITRKINSKWHPGKTESVCTTQDNDGYIVLKIDKKMYKAHRLAWMFVHGAMPEGQIDHINRVRNDNRIENLRLATQKQQNENRGIGANNTTGFIGVGQWKRDGKWRAYIYHNKQNIHIGQFDSFEDACAARIAFEKKLFTHSELCCI